MSISKAQAREFLNGYLQSLGDVYKKDPIVGKAIELLLFKYAEEWNKEVKLNLTKSKAIASGGLYDVSVPIVKQTPSGYVLSLDIQLTRKLQSITIT